MLKFDTKYQIVIPESIQLCVNYLHLIRILNIIAVWKQKIVDKKVQWKIENIVMITIKQKQIN